MKELHSQGKTIEDIEEVLKRVPIHPRIIPAIKSAHALGYGILEIRKHFTFLPWTFSFLSNYPGKENLVMSGD